MPSDPTRVICFGDSITQANGVADCERWTAVLQDLLDSHWPDACRVFNRGVGGHTCNQGFDRMAGDVLPLLPGLVLFEFGFNDAHVQDFTLLPRVGLEEFTAKLREMHRIVVSKGGQSVFLLNHTERSVLPQGNGKSYSENYAVFDAALRALVAADGLRAIDLPLLMRLRQVDLDTFLTADGIHLSAAGNRLYAEMVYDGLAALLAEGRITAALHLIR